MQNTLLKTVDVAALRIGMHVVLDIGWLRHPFASSSFKISQPAQIDALRALGRAQVVVDFSRSDRAALQAPDPADPPDCATVRTADGTDTTATAPAVVASEPHPLPAHGVRAQALAAQQQQLQQCEQRYAHAATTYRLVAGLCMAQPQAAAQQCTALVNTLLADFPGNEVAIRLLSESAGEKSAQHPVNVTVLALLLGRALGVSGANLHALGTAAFLHDIGKLQLPPRVRWWVENFSAQDTLLYQDHVALGVQRANAMGLSATALLAMAQHHKQRDGSGFPQGAAVRTIGVLGGILGLVNRYDNLVNPATPSCALTPHEAVARLFSVHKAHYDPVVLAAFIRMMGVYPPGTVVQLADARYALVVGVNSSRSLRPRVVLHDAQVPQHEALVLDLEEHPGLEIRRSVRPALLPMASLHYLAPRQQLNYFFEASSALAHLECAA